MTCPAPTEDQDSRIAATALDRALALADKQEAHFRDLIASTCGALAQDALTLIEGLREADAWLGTPHHSAGGHIAVHRDLYRRANV